MAYEGGCYCGALRYRAQNDPIAKAQCHCRECQYVSGGGPNYFMLVPPDGFEYIKGAPSQFTRSDLADPVTRDFCGICGTHILTRRSDRPQMIVKAGTLDDPAAIYGGPLAAIFVVDKQPFHTIPADLPCFERLPPR